MKNENNTTMGGREYRGGYSSEKACIEKMTMSEQFNYEQFYEQLSTMRYTKYLEELTPDPDNFSNPVCNYGIAYEFDHYVIRSPKVYIVPETADTEFVEVSYILNYPEEAIVLMKKNQLNQPGFKSCINDLIEHSIDFLNESKFTKDKEMENVNAYRKLMALINFVNKYKNFIYGKFNTSDRIVVITNGERYRRFFVVALKGNQRDIINKENLVKDKINKDIPEFETVYEWRKKEVVRFGKRHGSLRCSDTLFDAIYGRTKDPIKVAQVDFDKEEILEQLVIDFNNKVNTEGIKEAIKCNYFADIYNFIRLMAITKENSIMLTVSALPNMNLSIRANYYYRNAIPEYNATMKREMGFGKFYGCYKKILEGNASEDERSFVKENWQDAVYQEYNNLLHSFPPTPHTFADLIQILNGKVNIYIRAGKITVIPYKDTKDGRSIVIEGDDENSFIEAYSSKMECVKAFIDRMQVAPEETAQNEDYKNFFDNWEKYLEDLRSLNLTYLIRKDSENAGKVVDVFNSFVTTIMINAKFFKPNLDNGGINIKYFISNDKAICWTGEELKASNAATIKEGESCESCENRARRKRKLFIAPNNNVSSDNK